MVKLNSTDQWYRLDNAARIFPSIISDRMTSVFRISVELNEYVDPANLQASCDILLKRFPYYYVQLKTGLFWEYLQHINERITVKEERYFPCQKFRKKEDGPFLFRVLYYKSKIVVEFSHILTDGTGALNFMKALLYTYFNCSDELEEFDLQLHSIDEAEDSYKKYFDEDIPSKKLKTTAFHLPLKLDYKNYYNISTCLCDVKSVLTLSKSYKVSLTEYLVAHYMMSLQTYIEQNDIEKEKPIRIMVPVDLRKMFPSKSMRNFFLTISPEMDIRLGHYEFDEVLRDVHHYMRMEIDPKKISRQIARNVGGEENLFIKLIPLVIKQLFMAPIYRITGTSQNSGLLTNLGLVKLTDELSDKINFFEFLPNPNPATVVNMGVISYKKTLSLSIASLSWGTDIESIFFARLRDAGLKLKLISNRG